MPPTAALEARRASPRFRWPTRLVLGFLLFDIIVHSCLSLWGYRDGMEEQEIARFPRRWPTLQEIHANDAVDPPAERVGRSFDSVWDYFRPWPDKKTRD